MEKPVRICAVGDYNPSFPGHVTIQGSLEHAAESLSIPVSCEWVATTAITRENASDVLREAPTRAKRACSRQLNSRGSATGPTWGLAGASNILC